MTLEGPLDRIVKTIRLAGHINSTPDFYGQSQVINGISNLFVGIFGESGLCTRLGVNVSALPCNITKGI